MMHDLPAAAEYYAARGLYVFPVRAGDKRPPLHRDWPKHATSSAPMVTAEWQRHPDSNIGAATGRSGLVVLDIDSPDALVRARALVPDVLDSPWVVRTPKGWHRYYADDGTGWRPSVGRGETAGLDVRAATSYVVLPPSRLASGARYTWVTGGAMPEGSPEPPPAALPRRCGARV